MPVRSNSAESSFNPTQLPVYDMPYNPSPKFRTVERYLNAFHAMDYEGCMNVFDEDLEHRIIPQSLGRPVLNKRQYGEYFRGLMPRYKWLRFTLHEVIETEDKMTIHGTVKGESVRGTPYNNEYILMLHFAPLQMGESEQKICFVKEFVDSDTIIKFYAEDAARARAGGERSNSNSNRSIRSIENAPPRGRETMRPDVANGRESPRKREHQGYYVPARS